MDTPLAGRDALAAPPAGAARPARRPRGPVELKLWLRLLWCTSQIEAGIRRRLRARFGISLARFDYLAALHRHPQGLKMRELSRHLMVTGGSITGLTDELERDGLVVRESSPTDRRAWILRLTDPGRRSFEAMAREHEQWVHELFAGLDEQAVRELHGHLDALRLHLMRGDGVPALRRPGDAAMHPRRPYPRRAPPKGTEP